MLKSCGKMDISRGTKAGRIALLWMSQGVCFLTCKVQWRMHLAAGAKQKHICTANACLRMTQDAHEFSKDIHLQSGRVQICLSLERKCDG